MKSVMTLRLPAADRNAIEEVAARRKEDKSTAARELIGLGKVYFAILNYREGKISIGKAAELAGVTLSEMMETLAQLGIKSSLDVDDYLSGAKAAGELV